MLIGGKEGNVYTRIAEMDTFGAVCDDTWNLISVNFHFIFHRCVFLPHFRIQFSNCVAFFEEVVWIWSKNVSYSKNELK